MKGQKREKESTKEACVARQSLKTTRVLRPSEVDCQSLKTP